MRVQDRGTRFTVDGTVQNKQVFRKLLVDVIESSVTNVSIDEVGEREPIAQRDGYVAYPPHIDEGCHCIITDGEEQFEAEHRMSILRILQRI